jgi:hypothetical protein
VVLSEYRADTLRTFLENPYGYKRLGELPPTSPSDVIVDDLVARGFAA